MVYGIQKGGREGVVYCAMGVQYYCHSVGITGGGGQGTDDRLIHKSVKVNEYLVKTKLQHGIYFSITNIN